MSAPVQNNANHPGRLLPPPQNTSALSPQLQNAAADFTAVALTEMLAPMFDTMAADGGTFGGGAGEAAFRPMLIQQMAAGLARQGGLGLTNSVAQAMLHLQETKK